MVASVTAGEQQSALGRSNQGANPTSAQGRLERLLEKAAALPQLSVRCGTLAAGYYADHWVALVDDGKLTKMRARAVVFAQGAVLATGAG